jgi:hypothetical protein
MPLVGPLLACLAAFVVIAVPASAADEPLIGTNGHGRMRVLDPDLRIVAGTPALPKTTDATVLSTDNRRFASWSFYGKRLTIRSRRTFRALRTLPIERGTDVFWPTRERLLTVDYAPGSKRPNVIRSFNLARGTSRTVRLRDLPQYIQLHGQTLRVLTVRGPDLCCPNGPFVLTDVGPAGVVKRRWRVPLPDGFEVPDDSDHGVAVRPNGNLLFVTNSDRHALIKIHSGETKLLTGLADGYYDWVGRNILYETFGGHAARIDRRAMTVTGTADTGFTQEDATPFADGFIVGFGLARYDGELRRVAANPTPPDTEGFGRIVAHGRIYDLLTPDCDGPARAGAVIADGNTGRPIATRPGSWKFGVLGSGYLKSTAAEEICD